MICVYITTQYRGKWREWFFSCHQPGRHKRHSKLHGLSRVDLQQTCRGDSTALRAVQVMYLHMHAPINTSTLLLQLKGKVYIYMYL